LTRFKRQKSANNRDIIRVFKVAMYKLLSEEGERNRQMHTRSDERMHPPARAMLLFKHKF
jgi:hypothetical protein